jgi:exopolyphosphatase/guanosine-5'-triphosphate,3'-diphosphate pyrophosphatase
MAGATYPYPAPMRVAVVDIGTNSTRLLVADVAGDGALTELERRSTVTRLGQGVDATGRLADEAMERVFATLDDYRRAIDAHGAGPNIAVLTSAVRDAANGAQFTQRVRDRYDLDAHTIPGEQEARLTFVGATSERDDQAGDGDPMVVIDVGGGSTEFIVGSGRDVAFHVSTQAGVVRQSERHIASDPPRPEELEALAEDASRIIAAGVPAAVREGVTHAIAVAGTATSLGAIDLELDPYDPERVHGHRVTIQRAEELLRRLAEMTDDERRHVTGLHPDRAPTIVAGVLIFGEVLPLFGLDRVEISEHDILRGAALALS